MARPLIMSEILHMFERFKNLPFPPTLIGTLDKRREQRAATVLRGLQERGVLRIDPKYSTIIEAAAYYGTGIVGKADIHINILPGEPNRLKFADAMHELLADLRTLNKSRLNEMLTSSKPKQKKFADEIITECLTPSFCQEIAEFGVHISGEPVLDREIPHILFSVLDNGERCIGAVVLDGRSGMLTANHEPADKAYRDPEEFQAAVWQVIEDYKPASATG